ncbi:MAG: hypothetical protein NTV08_11805 [Verrucomicrobia bacterium]|nr:hypothetical protein [Verrucomicrobiota bacterium]
MTEVPACVGPGLLVEPGLGFTGVAGIEAALCMVKYSGVVYADPPDELAAFTFHR